ncbi:hypothetical protein CONLIGDRAFT_649035 [Coniochaeta ligniaria NRRL 30616]|uniref:Uncharacterized protein n=1 Tax=Coniochaeta ligniaria NRRL 30616 TaxID=1408157 RepID=A0A1J7J9S1_9PEZI|nr:hypothetical protein CONLIGDRAFT_649035 [Coniochaeta ligniaria NRRL 30616]
MEADIAMEAELTVETATEVETGDGGTVRNQDQDEAGMAIQTDGGKHRSAALVNCTAANRHHGHRCNRSYSFTGSEGNTDYGSAGSSGCRTAETPNNEQRKRYKC